MKISVDSVLIKPKPGFDVKIFDTLKRERYHLYPGDTCYVLKELAGDGYILLHMNKADNFSVFSVHKDLTSLISKNITIEIPDYFAELTSNPGMSSKRPIKL